MRFFIYDVKIKLILAIVVLMTGVLAASMSFSDSETNQREQITEEHNNITRSVSTTEKQEQSTELLNITEPDGDSERRYINKYNLSGKPRSWVLEEGNVSFQSPGTYEVTRYPNSRPTPEHINNSWKLYNRTYEAAEQNGWFEYQNAVEDGYIDHILIDGVHHYNVSYYLDGEQMNPEKPESLIYYEAPQNESNEILAGVMYQNIKKEGRQVGGPLTIWHYHPIVPRRLDHLEELISQETKYEDYKQIINRVYEKTPNNRLNRTGEMIHVWFVEHPGGPFGTGVSEVRGGLQDPEKMNRSGFKKYMLENFEERR